jgi:hypothetical protein
VDQRNVVMPAEQRHHLFRLTGTKKSMIDKHTGQLIADRLGDQNRRNRGIHAARKPADHLALTHLRPDRRDGAGPVGGHRPASRAAADTQREA